MYDLGLILENIFMNYDILYMKIVFMISERSNYEIYIIRYEHHY